MIRKKTRILCILYKIFFLFAGISLPLIFGEVFLRLAPFSRDTFNFKQYSNINERYGIKGLNKHDDNCYRPSSILGYEPIPNRCGHNSYGLLGEDCELNKEDGVYRILILGDSIAAHNFSVRFLRDMLNNTHDIKYKFELLNAAVDSYDVKRYANYLKYKGLRFHPDMVIVFFCLNDLNVYNLIPYKGKDGFVEYYFPGEEISKLFTPNRFLFKRSYLYRFLIVTLEGIIYHKKSKIISKERSNAIYYVSLMKLLCQRRGIPLIGVVFPYLKPLEEYNEADMSRYDMLSEVLRDLDIGYIDLHEYFPDEQRRALRRDKDDMWHPSKEGHRIAAEAIYSYLITRYFTQ